MMADKPRRFSKLCLLRKGEAVGQPDVSGGIDRRLVIYQCADPSGNGCTISVCEHDASQTATTSTSRFKHSNLRRRRYFGRSVVISIYVVWCINVRYIYLVTRGT